MTKEEAKQIIANWLVLSKGEKGQCGYIEGWFDEEDAEAFRMAIEVLSDNILGDGTLKINVQDAGKVKRVLVWGDDSGSLYYPDGDVLYHRTDRPKGHWKMYAIDDFKGRRTGEHAIICDRCLMKEIIRFGQSKWNFCPNCGADMREE